MPAVRDGHLQDSSNGVLIAGRTGGRARLAGEGSGSGGGTAGASHTEHVRQAATEDAKCRAEAPEPGGIGDGTEGPGDVLYLHEVRANGSDSLDIQ